MSIDYLRKNFIYRSKPTISAGTCYSSSKTSEQSYFLLNANKNWILIVNVSCDSLSFSFSISNLIWNIFFLSTKLQHVIRENGTTPRRSGSVETDTGISWQLCTGWLAWLVRYFFFLSCVFLWSSFCSSIRILFSWILCTCTPPMLHNSIFWQNVRMLQKYPRFNI